MLELMWEIAHRTTAQKWFNYQVVNPKTDATEPFVPSCCCLKNPMSASQLIQDEDAYKVIMVGYDEIINKKHKTYSTVCQTGGHNLQETPTQQVLKSLKWIAVDISTQALVRNKCFAEPVQFILNEKEVAYQVACKYILAFLHQTPSNNGISPQKKQQRRTASTNAVKRGYT